VTDPDGNTTNHSIGVSVTLASLNSYTSVTQSIFNGLEAAKANLSSAVSTTASQSVTLTLQPAYGLDTIAHDMAGWNSLQDLKDARQGIEKLMAQSKPSAIVLREFQDKLSKISSDLKNEASSAKPEEWRKLLHDLQETVSSIGKLLAQAKNPQNESKDLDKCLSKTLKELDARSGPVSALVESQKEELANKHLFLFTGLARFSLDPNTLDRFTLRIPPEYSVYFTLKQPRLVNNTFGNYEGLVWGISLAVASFHLGSIDMRRDIQPDFYLLGHFFLAPAEKPWDFQSASLFAGTQLSLSTPFNQIPFGFDWGDPFGISWFRDMGFLGGLDLWRNPKNTFDIRWFYGINYFL